jgi:hypothetical protein
LSQNWLWCRYFDNITLNYEWKNEGIFHRSFGFGQDWK